MGDRLVRKGLAIGIILLFVGSYFVTGLTIQFKNATYPLSSSGGYTLYVGGSDLNNESTVFVYDNSSMYLNKNFIKIPIQIYGPNNIVSFTITVTESQKKELDTFINSFKEDLEKTKNNADTVTNFINAIETLDEMGFIPNSFNYEQLQNQIIENVQYNNQVVKYIISNKLNNSFCFIAGEGDFICTSSDFLSELFGFWAAFGEWSAHDGGDIPADGWIYTSGKNGRWRYNGQFYGALGIEWIVDPWFYVYVGAKGFIGIEINQFLIGYAARVEIETV
jgi:hypothetical protein